MYKIGDKIVPHDKSVGCSLGNSDEWEKAQASGQKFLYVTSIDDDRCYWCALTLNDASSEYFFEDDLTPYFEEKSEETGLFQDFIGVTFSNINGKELLDLFDRGILKETDEFVMGRK